MQGYRDRAGERLQTGVEWLDLLVWADEGTEDQEIESALQEVNAVDVRVGVGFQLSDSVQSINLKELAWTFRGLQF